MKFIILFTTLSLAPLDAFAAEKCTQLERSIGLDAADCGKYNVVELGAIKSKMDGNDSRLVTRPRFVFLFGKNG